MSLMGYPGQRSLPLTPSVRATTTGSISQFTNHSQLLALNWLFTLTPVSRPTAWYMGLSTTVPTSSGGGVTEPIGNGYSRQSVTFSTPQGNPGQAGNASLINFTANGGDWGTILYGLVFDGLTLGSCLALGPLDSPRVIQNSDTLQFAQGSLSVGLT